MTRPERIAPPAAGVGAGRPRRRILAAAAVVLLVAGSRSAASAVPAAAPTSRCVERRPDAGVDGVRAPSDATGGTLRVVAAEIDSLDPQRSYLPGVWNLMRLYTRTLVTYSSEPGSTGELVPDLATDLGTPSEDGKSWTFTLREGVRFETGQPHHRAGRQVRHLPLVRRRRIIGGPTLHRRPARRPGQPLPGPVLDEEDRPGLTSVPTPDDRTIVFRLRARSPTSPTSWRCPRAAPCPTDADTRGDYGIDPISSGPYAITSVDAAMRHPARPQPEWDPATDDVRTALPDRSWCAPA